MRVQLSGDIVWLCGGLLYGWLMGALAQLAALTPAWARRVAAPIRVKPGCAQCRPHTRECGAVPAICHALLLIISPGVVAGGVTHAAGPVAAVVAGAFAGLWAGVLLDVSARVRAIAVAGCAGGLAALGGGFASFLARPEPASPEQRAALFLVVVLGALLLGAAASAGCGEVRARSHRPFTAGDRMVHLVALLLGIALGWGFAMASAGNEFGLPALVGAGVLGAAFGVRLMRGAPPPHIARFSLARHAGGGWPVTGSGALRPGLAGVPDDLLVEACSSGAFSPECLYARAAAAEGAASAVHHVSRDLPRRRRIRHRAPRHRQGPH